jgi:tripartite-type tricarboxylate transporter receptor subunit TctC
VVGSPPGGGVDTTARLYAQYAGKHHPGNPRFVVQNVTGAGQLRALQVGARAKPDGFTVSSLHTRWAVQSIMGKDLDGFDVKTVRVIGSPVADRRPGMICGDSRVIKSWSDVMSSGKQLTVGASEAGDRRNLGAAALELMGAPVKNVYGYGGSAESLAAFDRGELTGVACPEDIIPRQYPDWLTQKRLTPLFWWTAQPEDAYIARMGTAAKPVHVFDLPGVKASDEMKLALNLTDQMFLFTRALVLPPKTPDNIYQAWKKAYEATIQDPEFVAAADKGGIDVSLGKAEEFEAALRDTGKLSKDGIETFRKLMGDTD